MIEMGDQEVYEMIGEEGFALLVAARGGAYDPPSEIQNRVRTLSLPPELDEVSSSEVRRRIRAGERWRDLVPDSIAKLIEQEQRGAPPGS